MHFCIAHVNFANELVCCLPHSQHHRGHKLPCQLPRLKCMNVKVKFVSSMGLPQEVTDFYFLMPEFTCRVNFAQTHAHIWHGTTPGGFCNSASCACRCKWDRKPCHAKVMMHKSKSLTVNPGQLFMHWSCDWWRDVCLWHWCIWGFPSSIHCHLIWKNGTILAMPPSHCSTLLLHHLVGKCGLARMKIWSGGQKNVFPVSGCHTTKFVCFDHAWVHWKQCKKHWLRKSNTQNREHEEISGHWKQEDLEEMLGLECVCDEEHARHLVFEFFHALLGDALDLAQICELVLMFTSKIDKVFVMQSNTDAQPPLNPLGKRCVVKTSQKQSLEHRRFLFRSTFS